MSDARLLFHGVDGQTVTLFVDPNPLRADFLDEHPDENGPILRVCIATPDEIVVTPSTQSELFSGYGQSGSDFSLIADQDEFIRASFDWERADGVRDRGQVSDDTLHVTLQTREGEVLDQANVLF